MSKGSVRGTYLIGSGNDEAGQMRLRQAYEERDAAKDCDRLSFMLGPHAPYTCDDGFMRIVSKEAKKNGMGIHVHLSESLSEIEQHLSCLVIAASYQASADNRPHPGFPYCSGSLVDIQFSPGRGRMR
mgnify:CR=1 FL=1